MFILFILFIIIFSFFLSSFIKSITNEEFKAFSISSFLILSISLFLFASGRYVKFTFFIIWLFFLIILYLDLSNNIKFLRPKVIRVNTLLKSILLAVLIKKAVFHKYIFS